MYAIVDIQKNRTNSFICSCSMEPPDIPREYGSESHRIHIHPMMCRSLRRYSTSPGWHHSNSICQRRQSVSVGILSRSAPVGGGTDELVFGIERSHSTSEIAPGILVVFGAVPAAEVWPSGLSKVQSTRRTGFVRQEVSHQLLELQVAGSRSREQRSVAESRCPVQSRTLGCSRRCRKFQTRQRLRRSRLTTTRSLSART